MSMRRFPRAAAGLRLACPFLTVLFVAACDENFVEPGLPAGSGAQIVPVSGNNQSGAVGSPLRQTLRVQVRDSRGQPVARQRVEFRTLVGDGRLSALAGVTDLAGFTEVRFTPLSAGDLVVEATQDGETEARTLFSLFAIDSSQVRDPATLEVVGGNNQTGAVGSILPQPLAVRVLNLDGNPIPGSPVLFTATTEGTLLLTVNDGDFTQIDSLGGIPQTPDSVGTQVVSFTNANGLAAVLLRLSPVPGSNQVTASSTFVSGAGNTVSFNATGVAGGPTSADSLIKVAGDNQTVSVDTVGLGGVPSITFNPMVVLVTDRFGNAVSGVTVTFRVSVGFGSLSNTTAVTDAAGFAQTTYTSAEGSFGGFAVSATAPGVRFNPQAHVFTGSITPVGQPPAEDGGGGGGGG